MRGAGFRGGTDGGRGQIGEREGLDCVIEGAGGGCVVLGGDVEGELEERLAVGFYE